MTESQIMVLLFAWLVSLIAVWLIGGFRDGTTRNRDR